jgi:hypothetical protein
VSGVKRVRKPQTSIRRKKFVKNLVDGLGVGQSALRAGFAHASEGSALLREPSVLTALQTAMAKAGIDDEYLSSKIREGLEATYPTKRSKDGNVLQAEAPDFFTRGLYLDKALKVRGDYSPERHIEEKRTLTINVNMEMARGLIDCGAVTVEEIQRLDGDNDAGISERQGNETRNLLAEGRETDGTGQEDSGEPKTVREETQHAGQDDLPADVPEETERDQGSGPA